MIEIDGSFGEGGGSVLRTSIAMSLLTQKPFRIFNIRKNRSKPGLRKQHLTCLELAQKISEGKLVNAYEGSQEVEFYPGKIKGGSYEIDVKSAGSVFLVLQSVFFPVYLSKKKVKIKLIGGTDVPFSPGLDYFNNMFLYYFKEGTKIISSKRGFNPKGQGNYHLSIKGDSFELPKSQRGDLVAIKGVVFGSSNTQKELDIMLRSLDTLLTKHKVKVDILKNLAQTKNPDFGCFVYAIYDECRVGSGEISNKKSPYQLGETVAKRLNEYLDSYGLDPLLADQLFLFYAHKREDFVTTKITPHLKSNIYVYEEFTNKKIKLNEAFGEVICR